MTTELATTGDLDEQIEQALKPLTAKQRLFVEHHAAGLNGTMAAMKAGYSENRARHTASRLVTNGSFANVQHALALLRRKYAWEHGIPAAWKRMQLVELFGQARELEQCSAANQTMRTLAEIDGDIRTPANAVPGNVQIVVNTGIARDEKPVNE